MSYQIFVFVTWLWRYCNGKAKKIAYANVTNTGKICVKQIDKQTNKQAYAFAWKREKLKFYMKKKQHQMQWTGNLHKCIFAHGTIQMISIAYFLETLIKYLFFSSPFPLDEFDWLFPFFGLVEHCTFAFSFTLIVKRCTGIQAVTGCFCSMFAMIRSSVRLCCIYFIWLQRTHTPTPTPNGRHMMIW